MTQDWGNFFDQAPTTESAVPVAAMRAAVRPGGGGPFGKSVAFPTPRPMMPSALVQPQARQPDMTPMPMPEPPKALEQGHDLGDMAKGIAGIIDPESQQKDKGDGGFGERMSAIDKQLEEMRADRARMAEAVAKAAAQGQGSATSTGGGTAYKGGQGAGSDAAGPQGFSYNVGNLRTSGANWAGKGAPHNGFETFDSPQSGASAMFHNLASYATGSPGMTMAGAISKWAPPSENNTGAYIAHVAQQAGIDPSTPLAQILADPEAAAKMMMAMARMEKGGSLHSAFTPELFKSVVGGGEKKEPEEKKAEGGRIRYLRSFLGA